MIEENLLVGLQARTDGLSQVPSQIYDMFPILKDFPRRGGDLSGGQQQQLAIDAPAKVQILLLMNPLRYPAKYYPTIGAVLKDLATARDIVLVEQYLDFVKGSAIPFLYRIEANICLELQSLVTCGQHLGV